MNIDNNLIFIKGEDKTASVESYRYDPSRHTVYIRYANQYGHLKEYPYNASNVYISKDPKIITLEERIALKNGLPLSGAKYLQGFGQYYRIIYGTGYKEVVRASSIQIIESALRIKESRDCFEYLKHIADKTGLIVNGSNILAKNYARIGVVREDSVLAAFLSGKYEDKPSKNNSTVVYPFGFNLSQKIAIDNALNHRISIIEGPPGTGKTQTILNIIANAVMRGESVAVVSSNNSATANVLEKLKKYGVDFIAAPLGNSTNKEAFIESQNPVLPDMSRWTDNTNDLSALRQDEVELDRMLKLQNELSAITAEQNRLEKEYVHFGDYYKTLTFQGALPRFADRISAAKILAFIAEYELLLPKEPKIGFFKKLILGFTYGIKDFRFYGKAVDIVVPYCQNIYYNRRLSEIKARKTQLQAILKSYDFDFKMKQYSAMSMRAFKASLAKKYGSARTRPYFESDDLWKRSDEFIRNYPVVLSTTYSLRASLSSSFVYDYVIVDEASQVDLATGALALSCAKKTVIVGDLKQLPNVVDRAQESITDWVFGQYHLPET